MVRCEQHAVPNRDWLSLGFVKEGGAFSEQRLVEGTMQIAWQAEIGLAEIDDRIADADRNLRELGLLIPELAIKGYSTAEIEGDLLTMTKALHGLRAQRRTIVETLDGNEPPPRIARPTARPRPRTAALATSAVASTGGVSTWRSIYARLRRS